MPGQNTVRSVVGPLATSARSLRLMVQSTLSQEPWLHDPRVTELPWNPERALLPSKLVFGVYRSNHEDDDLAGRPLPPVKRGLEELVSLAQKMGHEIIEWEPPSHIRAMKIAVRCLSTLNLVSR